MNFKKLPPKRDYTNYLTLKPGEKVRGVFRGDPHEFNQHWVNGRSSECAGVGCENCANGVETSLRFCINLITEENKAYVAKVFQFGRPVYETLSSLQENDYDLENHMISITRTGSGVDTRYSIVPIANGTLSPAQKKLIASVPLNKFGEYHTSNEDDASFNVEDLERDPT